nr:MAG TPA: hypothetical protein [Caudoviricetes sp.]
MSSIHLANDFIRMLSNTFLISKKNMISNSSTSHAIQSQWLEI